jgi:hypothetical protein
VFSLYLQEYDNGKLIRQSMLDASELDAIFGKKFLTAPHQHVRHRGGSKVAPKQVTKLGEVLYKGHPSYDLMLQLQLGIRCGLEVHTLKGVLLSSCQGRSFKPK